MATSLNTPPAGTRKLSTTAFNRLCYAGALAWLVIVIPASLVARPTQQDFSGIYIGALVARLGEWSSLYPVPAPGSRYYVGADGVQKPRLLAIAAENGVRELNLYLQPPWQAAVLRPLGSLTPSRAQWAMILALILSSWGVAISAGKFYELSLGQPARAAGLVALLVACSLLSYRVIRVQNLSPLVALSIAITIWDLMAQGPPLRPKGWVGGAAIAFGSALKMAPAVLLPLAAIMRRWAVIGWAAGVGAVIIAGSFAMAGRAVFVEYFSRIAPTFAGSALNTGNKSLQGFLLRAIGRSSLPGSVAISFHAARVVTLLFILWLLGRRPLAYWRAPVHVFAGAVALLCWLLIFAPLCWEHYFFYLCPFWGWLAWEGRGSRGRRIAVTLAIASSWFPLPVIVWMKIPEPINSYMLGGLFLMLGIAVVRLCDEPRRENNAIV